MKNFLLVAVLFLYSNTMFSQEFNLIGPRAGIGILSGPGIKNIKEGVHSAFGWQVEIPYKSSDLTGYGEGGLMLLAIEQGKIFPHVWAYFGVRGREFGLGAGPAINPIGIGLGINPYYQIELEKLRIPIGFNLDFIRGTQRYQLSICFMYN
jgi:hypothetical protein